MGLSEASAETIRRAHAVHPIAAVQSELSLWSRDYLSDVVPLTKGLGIAFVPYSPLGRGFLTGALKDLDSLAADDWRRNNPRFQGEALEANRKIVEAVEAVAARKGVKASQIALAWTLAQGEHVVPIPGTKRVAYLEENAAAAEVILTADDLRELDAIPAAEGMRYPESVYGRAEPLDEFAEPCDSVGQGVGGDRMAHRILAGVHRHPDFDQPLDEVAAHRDRQDRIGGPVLRKDRAGGRRRHLQTRRKRAAHQPSGVDPRFDQGYRRRDHRALTETAHHERYIAHRLAEFAENEGDRILKTFLVEAEARLIDAQVEPGIATVLCLTGRTKADYVHLRRQFSGEAQHIAFVATITVQKNEPHGGIIGGSSDSMEAHLQRLPGGLAHLSGGLRELSRPSLRMRGVSSRPMPPLPASCAAPSRTAFISSSGVPSEPSIASAPRAFTSLATSAPAGSLAGIADRLRMCLNGLFTNTALVRQRTFGDVLAVDAFHPLLIGHQNVSFLSFSTSTAPSPPSSFR